MVRSLTLLAWIALAAHAADVPVAESSRRESYARYGAARVQARSDDAPRAVRNLEAAAKLDPTAAAPRRELVSVYADLGRDAAAIRMARAVLAGDPKDADTAHRLAKLLFEVKRYSEAADALAAALDGDRLVERATKALAMRIDLARCRDRANEAAKAAAAWGDVREFLAARSERLRKEGFSQAELDREMADAAEHHGRALVARQRFDDARDAFLAARKLLANDRAGAARLHRNLAELAAAAGQPNAAIAHYEEFLAFGPRDPEPYRRYADQLRKAGRDVEAILAARSEPAAKWALLAERAKTPAGFGAAHEEFRELAAAATDPALFRLLCTTYATADSGSGILEIAEVIFPATPERLPRKPVVVPAMEGERRQAFAAAFAAQPALALKATRAAQLSSGTKRSPEFWDLLAWACERAGQPDAVERALRASFEADGNFRSFQRLHRHLYGRRKWRAILDLCNSAGSLGAGALNYYRAAAHAELGNAPAALAAIAKAEGDNAFASRREKVHILGILGRHDEMLKECDAAMAEFRSSAEVRSLRYLRAQAFLGLKKLREAEEELRGILDDDADDALALNNLGYNLADQNRKLDEAERLIRRAIEIEADDRARAGEPNVDHAPYLDSLGWVLFRKGRLAEAREQLEKAATLPDGANDPTVWDHLGDVALRQGDAKRAKEAWTIAERQYATTHVGREGGRRDEASRKIKQVE